MVELYPSQKRQNVQQNAGTIRKVTPVHLAWTSKGDKGTGIDHKGTVHGFLIIIFRGQFLAFGRIWIFKGRTTW